MQIFARAVVTLFLTALLAACSTDAMTHAQWKQEQDNRLNAQKAGQPYKSPSEVRAEVDDMRKAVKDTKFDPEAK